MLQQFILMAPAGGAQGGNPLMQILPLVLIVVVFYFFMIRPQVKKAKDQKKYIEALKKGDKIVTIGGLYGVILRLNDKTATIQIAEKVEVEIARTAISGWRS